MKKILSIGASNSKSSINKILANHIANKLELASVTSLDWSEIELPLYSVDVENEIGIPKAVYDFKKLIDDSDAIVLSLAEHNGLMTSVFKNLWDWTSRIEQKFWADKPLFLAATSPGGRGGIGALEIVRTIIPHFGGNVLETFSLPKFYDNFKDGTIVDAELEKEMADKINKFNTELKSNKL